MSQPTPSGSTKGLPTTPKRKSILTNKQTTESPEASPTSPNQQHTYTSLASVRKANKAAAGGGGTPERDRKNGWHLWSAEEAERNGANGGGGRGGGDVERGSGGVTRGSGPTKKDGKKGKKERLTQWDMITMTLGMGGAQIAWCLEMGFGTPELLSLGLTEELTSLVWLAGPISGLITQPLIGAISDNSTSKYRRRYWIVLSSGLMILSCLMLAYARPIGVLTADLWGIGEGDWDPKWKNAVQKIGISVAIVAFYGLDFAVNALQASLRNMLLDVTPAEQLSEANAWVGRMTHMGSILGFTLGFLDMSKIPVLRSLGGGNFRKLCVIIVVILVFTVWVSCTTEEEEREEEFGVRKGKVSDIIGNIYNSILHLPRPIRRVCYVQIFAFMSWFPFLFYGTSWVAEVMTKAQHGYLDREEASRAGSLAMLFYSVVAVTAGTVLPWLADRDRRLLAPDLVEEDDEHESEEDREMRKIREMVKEWKQESKQSQKPIKLPTMPFMLRNIWTSALVLFSFLMLATFFVETVWQAQLLTAMIGISWAVAAWVPFSLLMEYLKEMQDRADLEKSGPGSSSTAASLAHPAPHTFETRHQHPGLHSRALSTPGRMLGARDGAAQGSMGRLGAHERSALLVRSRSYVDTTELDDDEDRMKNTGDGPVAGGTIMGIHNLAVVFPQFVVALVSSVIFKLVANAGQSPSPPGNTPPGFAGFAEPDGDGVTPTGFAWVLRFGGVCALAAAAISRKVPPTKTEKAMRRRLAEMQQAELEDDE